MSEHPTDENPNIAIDEDPAPAGLGDENLEKEPGVGGYAGRDPKTEMPRMPSIPETQGDDATEHGGAPKVGKAKDPHSD